MNIKINTFFIVLAFSGISFGQSKEPKLKFDKSSDTLTKAIGYKKAVSQFIEHKNVINSMPMYASDKEPGDWMSSDDNFTYITTKMITYNNANYYLLIVEDWEGKFKYPTLKMEYYTYKVVKGYLFDEKEFKKLDNITNKPTEVKTKHTVIPNFSEDKVVSNIQYDLSQKPNKYATNEILKVVKTDKGDIRFLLPGSKLDFKENYFETDVSNFSKILIK